MFAFDLKSSYHHVDIHEALQSYLGFTWGEGIDKSYVFRDLPLIWHATKGSYHVYDQVWLHNLVVPRNSRCKLHCP